MQTLNIVSFLVIFVILSFLVIYRSFLKNANDVSNEIQSDKIVELMKWRNNTTTLPSSNVTTNLTSKRKGNVSKLHKGNSSTNESKHAWNSIQLLKCENQTKCIQPQLQLRQSFKVYYCKHINYGIRFYYLVKEGLLLHPKITLVGNPNHADFIVYLPESSNWQKTECNNQSWLHKIIALDESDYPNLFKPEQGQFLMTFKRSYVKRVDGSFKHYMSYVTEPNVFPMTYIVAEIYVRHLYKNYHERSIDMLCSLRAMPSDPTRTRVKTWIDEYIQSRGLKEAYSGQVNTASRPTVSKAYFERMYSSKIIVTSNPSNWEGDFRLCEALATGALIFVDEMFVPRPNPFEDRKHLVIYNNHNKTDLFQKLDYYRSHFEESKNIAARGYLHAMFYHRATNLIDYVFRTLHLKMLADVDHKLDALIHDFEFASRFIYSDSGYALRLQAIRAQKRRRNEKK